MSPTTQRPQTPGDNDDRVTKPSAPPPQGGVSGPRSTATTAGFWALALAGVEVLIAYSLATAVYLMQQPPDDL